MEELGHWLASCEVVHPWYFVTAAVAMLLLILLPVFKRRGLAVDLRYWASRVEFKSRRRLVLSVLAVASSLLIAAGLAQPRVTVKPSISIYGKPVVAVVDVSGSMGAKPRTFVGGVANRDLRNGYEKARDIFQDLIGRRPDVNFALLLYSTESYIARYYAYKNELLSDTIENKKEIEYISTGTKTAIALAKARYFLTETVQGRDKAIVLISDLNGDLAAMVELAEEMERLNYAGIKLYIIIITADDKIPANLPSPVDGVRMVEMNDVAGVNEIVRDISYMQNSPLRQEEVVQKASLIPYFALPALAFVVAALVLTETRFRKIP